MGVDVKVGEFHELVFFIIGRNQQNKREYFFIFLSSPAFVDNFFVLALRQWYNADVRK